MQAVQRHVRQWSYGEHNNTYPKLRVLLCVELAVRKESRLVVLGSIRGLRNTELDMKDSYLTGDTYKDSLAHEWEGLSVPEVAVVHRAHEDISQDDTDILVDLEPQRVEQAVRTDEIPVKGPGKESHALVVARTSEDVAEHRAVVVGQAEDRDTGEQGEDPYKMDECQNNL